ncbi:MAG: phosphoribosylglycinamide formyltransferase [Verrucomicrobiota bacterium]
MTSSKSLKIAVLGSGRGSNFIALYENIVANSLPVEVCLVASDFADAKILEIAAEYGLLTFACPPSRFKTKLEPEIETALAEAIQSAGAELVILAGFMRVVKAPLLNAFPQRIINIHPSLLPDFKGLEAWKQALDAGVKETGCTVHWVDSSLDGGAIISQSKVPVLSGDSPTSLHLRIQKAEHQLLPSVVNEIALGKIPLGLEN